MENFFDYYQPEYVSKFKCDGQKCKAHCCGKWRIDIDKQTYKKYSHLKPKSVAREITSKIKKNDKTNEYTIQLNEKLFCPFLTEDNWCSIQRQYGEEYLSITCAVYPRRIYDFGNFYERSLVLTCPIVAELVLFSEEPLKFETTQVPARIHHRGGVHKAALQGQMADIFLSVQKTSISILQQRTLTIDERLSVLGLYTDKVSLVLQSRQIGKMAELNSMYGSADFLAEVAQKLSETIKFNVRAHVRFTLLLLEALYGGDSDFRSSTDMKIINTLSQMLKVEPDENNMVDIGEIIKNYNSTADERQKFLQEFSPLLENYLVNEFFYNLYPVKFTESMMFNYGVFITVYKMLENLALAMTLSRSGENPNYSPKEDLKTLIMWYASKLDHSRLYLKKIHDYLKENQDMAEIMQNMLQV